MLNLRIFLDFFICINLKELIAQKMLNNHQDHSHNQFFIQLIFF